MASAGAGPGGGPGAAAGDGGGPPRSQMITSARLFAPITWTPGTRAASSTFCAATTTVCAPRAAATTAGSTPGTGRSRPSRPSSARNIFPASALPGHRLGGGQDGHGDGQVEAGCRAWAGAAGESPTVIFEVGQLSPLLTMAARIRSRASRSAVSGRPTRIVAGSPLAMSASTSIRCPSTPTSATEKARARVT